MSRLLGIAGVQMSVIPWNASATVDKMETVVQSICARTPWVQLIIFHELAAQGVTTINKDEYGYRQPDVQSIPGPLTDRLCEIAKKEKKWLVPGSIQEFQDGKQYNTALVISPEGEIIAKYRKMFPWYPIENGTTAGDQFCVFDIPDIGRFGLCICYDMWYPEVIRNLVWMGAEVILHPTMTYTPDRQIEVVISQANAATNQCYFVDINGIGLFVAGRSLIVDPNGRVVQQAYENETILTEIIDLDLVTHVREYGTLGLSQTLKQLRDSKQRFPMYEEGIANGEGFKKLGELKFHHKLE
jgi:predicted amidohydrolase